MCKTSLFWKLYVLHEIGSGIAHFVEHPANRNVKLEKTLKLIFFIFVAFSIFKK